ncbi:MAG: small acid-soluble spore protein SspI [Planifilum sp.]|jgi:small acid-soluble spore protein I (minor)
MNIDVRGAVIHNIQHMSKQELTEMVNDTLQQQEEKLLPGLGVLFEIIWENSEPASRKEMISTLHENLPRDRAVPPVSPS